MVAISIILIILLVVLIINIRIFVRYNKHIINEYEKIIDINSAINLLIKSVNNLTNDIKVNFNKTLNDENNKRYSVLYEKLDKITRNILANNNNVKNNILENIKVNKENIDEVIGDVEFMKEKQAYLIKHFIDIEQCILDINETYNYTKVHGKYSKKAKNSYNNIKTINCKPKYHSTK